jgi:outer membrane murein-binding lipoprotein Lpp
MPSRLVALLFASVVVSAAAVAGCSEESAADQVCDARDELRQSVDEVADDVASGNLGDAQDSLEGVRDSFDDLRDAAGDLGAEERQALQPQVDQLQDDLSAIADSTDLEELQSSFETVSDDVQAMVDQVSDTLDCS